jgi:hypothetical protein
LCASYIVNASNTFNVAVCELCLLSSKNTLVWVCATAPKYFSSKRSNVYTGLAFDALSR